jgi:hypothetical protein
MAIAPPRRRRRRLIWIAFVVLGFVAACGIVGGAIRRANEDGGGTAVPSAPTTNTSDTTGLDPTVFTYLFYWYDSQTNAHLNPESGLPTHLPDDPPPTWRSVDWFRKQLSDMAYAGIDVALPVYWGTGEEWSVQGLPNLAQAKLQMAAEGQDAPQIGLFFDTTVLDGKDLTSAEGKQFFYDDIRIFFSNFPRQQWALVDGGPVISIFFSFFPTAFDQSTFNFIYDSFERDFGVRPYIMREQTWSFAVTSVGERHALKDQPIATEASYKWGAALDGYSDVGNVASVGPGFDEREIPGRGNAVRDREDGQWYRDNFNKAIASGKRLLVIETWNEIHEASGISETVEYGRTYLDLTRQLVQQFKQDATGERSDNATPH